MTLDISQVTANMAATVFERHSLKTRITLTVLTIFLVSLWALSYYARQMLHEDMERLLGEQQFSTLSVVANSINEDLHERIGSLKTVAAIVSPPMLDNTAALQTLLEQLPLLERQFNGGVIAYRLDGTAIAGIPLTAERIDVNYMDIDTIAAVLKEGWATIGQPIMGKQSQAQVFSMTVPVHDAQGAVIGALSGVTNLGKPNFLDKITKNRYGMTGGYMLVAPQYRLIVTATDKRRIMEMMPAPGINPLVDRFIQGYEGSGVVLNPHGVEVLASAKGVPVTGWYVAAALPTAEAFAPIHAMQQRMLLATIILTLLAGALTWWLLRRQLAPMLAAARTLATLSETNQPPQPLAITRPDEIGQMIGGFNRLLETLAQREQALHIAAIAFECQEGIIVMDANLKILRVNQAFTQITGYTQQEAQGQTTDLLRSDRHPASFYDTAWRETQRSGAWQGDMWHRRKNGEDYPDRVTITAVRDEDGQTTHYVCNLTDASNSQLQEQQRLCNETAQRNLLVREVHHRIKNNLQGITGVLRQFAQQHPELASPLKEAIGRVQGIAVIHGLQGRAITSSARLCELTDAIAEQVQNLWQTPVTVDTPAAWLPCDIIESEAVPIALILNELILNAVKHGGKAQGQVSIILRKGVQPDVVQITIVNAGQLSGAGGHTDTAHNGLQLIAALMPRSGARIVRAQQGDQVNTLLELAPPVISLELKEPT